MFIEAAKDKIRDSLYGTGTCLGTFRAFTSVFGVLKIVDEMKSTNEGDSKNWTS
jgi:hypothetical protein